MSITPGCLVVVELSCHEGPPHAGPVAHSPCPKPTERAPEDGKEEASSLTQLGHLWTGQLGGTSPNHPPGPGPALQVVIPAQPAVLGSVTRWQRGEEF